jgi:hypothetical protein
MIRREVPEQIGKAQAWVPVGAGLIAPIISTVIAVGLGMLTIKLHGGEITQSGVTMPVQQAQQETNVVLRSLIKSFRVAGFTEELVKLLLALLMVKIFKPKNVYEYALAFIGVGFGFTALEEVLYGGGGLASLSRLPGFAMHMVFAILMGVNLGLARYAKLHGGSAGKHIFLGLFLPVLWHTLYDAATTFNAGFDATDENVQVAAVVIALIVTVASTVLQFVLLVRFKNNAVKYSEMVY